MAFCGLAADQSDATPRDDSAPESSRVGPRHSLRQFGAGRLWISSRGSGCTTSTGSYGGSMTLMATSPRTCRGAADRSESALGMAGSPLRIRWLPRWPPCSPSGPNPSGPQIGQPSSRTADVGLTLSRGNRRDRTLGRPGVAPPSRPRTCAAVRRTGPEDGPPRTAPAQSAPG
jgi:hypothetical protein